MFPGLWIYVYMTRTVLLMIFDIYICIAITGSISLLVDY